MCAGRISWIVGLVLAVLLAIPAAAQENAEKLAARAKEEAKAKPKPLFVMAVMNFRAKGKAMASLCEDVPNLLAAFLSQDESLELVERAEIKKLLEEMALGKTGIVKSDEAARVGMMTGAKFLVTGQIFTAGKKLYITAKVMSTETSKVVVQLAKGPLDGELDEIVMDLAEKIKTLMAKRGASMLPPPMTRKDMEAELKKKLAGKKLPSFAVKILERHIGRPVPDPAAETEVGYLLRAAGATVLSTKEETLMSDWAKQFLKETNSRLPSALKNADILLIGQGFSEYAGRMEKLISVKARVELKAVDTKTGKILAFGRAHATAVDLAELIAGKTALQKAAADIAMKLIPETVDAYNRNLEAAGKKPAKEK